MKKIEEVYNPYTKSEYDDWVLKTLQTDNDFDIENFDLNNQNTQSSVDLFFNIESQDYYRNASEDGSEFIESPYDSYAIFDLHSQRQRLKRRMWLNFIDRGEDFGNEKILTNKFKWSRLPSMFNNNFNYKSLGVYDSENFNKKKIVYNNKNLLNFSGNLEVLNNNILSDISNNENIEDYNKIEFNADPSDLFSWNTENILEKNSLSNVLHAKNNPIKNVKNAEKYSNKKLNYTHYFENELGNIINTKDFYWDSDINDRFMYVFNKKNHNSNSFNNYSEYLEKYKLIGNSYKNKKYNEFINLNNNSIFNDLIKTTNYDKFDTKFKTNEIVSDNLQKISNLTVKKKFSENSSYYDNILSLSQYKDYNFWDHNLKHENKSTYEIDSIVDSKYLDTDFFGVKDNIYFTMGKNVEGVEFKENNNKLEHFGIFNSYNNSSNFSKVKEKYKNNYKFLESLSNFSSDISNRNNNRWLILSQLNWFFLKGKNDLNYKLENPINSNNRWSIRNSVNLKSGTQVLNNQGKNNFNYFDNKISNSYNLLSFKLFKYSELDDIFDSFKKSDNIKIYELFLFDYNFLWILLIRGIENVKLILKWFTLLINEFYLFFFGFFGNFNIFYIEFLNIFEYLYSHWVFEPNIWKFKFITLNSCVTSGNVNINFSKITKLKHRFPRLFWYMEYRKDESVLYTKSQNFKNDLYDYKNPKKNNNLKNYTLIGDDLLSYHFEIFKINTKFGLPSQNSIKINNNFNFNDKIVLPQLYWEYFSTPNSNFELYDNLEFQDFDKNINISDYISNYRNNLTYSFKNKISQELVNLSLINNYFYNNFNRNYVKFKNYNNLSKFYLNSNFTNKNKLNKYLTMENNQSNNKNTKNLENDSIFDTEDSDFIFEFSNFPIFINLNKYDLDDNYSELDLQSRYFHDNKIKKFNFNFSYLDELNINNSSINFNTNYYLKNLLENKLDNLQSSDTIESSLKNTKYLEFLSKDWLSKKEFIEKQRPLTLFLKNQIISDQLLSFYGSFWLSSKKKFNNLIINYENNSKFKIKLFNSFCGKNIWTLINVKNKKHLFSSIFVDNFKKINKTYNNFFLKNLKILNFETKYLNNYNNVYLNYFELKYKLKLKNVNNKKFKNSITILFNKNNKNIYQKILRDNIQYFYINDNEGLDSNWESTVLKHNPLEIFNLGPLLRDVPYIKEYKNKNINNLFEISDLLINSESYQKLWSDIELDNSLNFWNTTDIDIFDKNKYRVYLEYVKSLKSTKVFNFDYLNEVKTKKYDWIKTQNNFNSDIMDKVLNLDDMSLTKKKFNKFIQKPNEYKKLGGIKNYPIYRLFLKIMDRVNPNVWTSDMFPNYRKRQLYLGLSYIPEQFVYKNYKFLNKDSHISNRIENYYFKNKNLKFLFDLSYPINYQFPINHLNLMDKHILGSDLDKKIKFKNKFSFNNYYSKRFDNYAYEYKKTPYNNIIPFYLTNRNSKFMEIINKEILGDGVNVNSMLRLGSPTYINLYGYHNLLNMGNSKNLNSSFTFKKNVINKEDFYITNNDFLYKKNKGLEYILGTFNNSSKSKLVDDNDFKYIFDNYSKTLKFKWLKIIISNKKFNFHENIKLYSKFIIDFENKKKYNYKNFRFRNLSEIINYFRSSNQKQLIDILIKTKDSKISKILEYEKIYPINVLGEDLIFCIDTIDESINKLSDLNFIFFENSNWTPIWIPELFNLVEDSLLENALEIYNYEKILNNHFKHNSKNFDINIKHNFFFYK